MEICFLREGAKQEVASKNDYVIYTDSAVDTESETLEKWGVKYCCLTFRFDGEDEEYSNDDMTRKEFYNRMRKGDISRTAAVNVDTFEKAFEEELKEGRDVLYIGFSSGLSTTSNSAIMAANELQEKYPDRKIIALDPLIADAGQALMVYLTVQKKKEGATIEEAADFVRTTAPHISTWYTVDDLVYLKRGGRVSSTAAFAATVLDIKPVMHVDDEGKLENVRKVRGRKKAISALIEKYDETALDKKGLFAVCHADAKEEAEGILHQIESQYGAKGLLAEMGPVIGSHAGPGCLVLAYECTER